MFFFLTSAADCSRLRLAAACGIIKIAQEAHCIEYITLEVFQQLSLVMQVIDYELAICASPIIHLVCVPKFCITIVFYFSWDHCNTLERLQT